jgi:hypothetical protein
LFTKGIVPGRTADLDKTIVEAMAKGKQASSRHAAKGQPTPTIRARGFAQALR